MLAVTADQGIGSAWSAYDAHNHALARRLYEQAALLVDSADDNAQRAYLYANLVQQSTCLARFTDRKDLAREALRFGDRAADAARSESSPALRALIALRRSLAHAQLGDAGAFRADIATARRELDRGPHGADTPRTRFVRHSEITGYEAAGCAALGRYPQAVRLNETVLDDTARSPRDSADALAERIIAAEKKGRRFIAKFGIDPTGAEVHLGHTVPMLILSRFRRMGHHAVSIVDDMTVKIGARAAAATASTTASR